MFKDRQSAGKILAKRLQDIQGVRGNKEAIVLGIPRGGVVVAHEVAKELKLSLDIIVTRKIGAPMQPELAVGAVDADGQVVWDYQLLKQLEFQISNFKFQIEEERNEIKRREQVYRQGRSLLDVSDKTVILVDDGIATGATTLAAIRFFKRHGARKIILAVPVASKEALDRMVGELGEVGPPAGEAGEIVVLEIPEHFQAVGQFYEEFGEVSDEEVVQLLNNG
ncbi:phosphoribosyltransferase [Candidatus Daviesbacteria bacterium]|nr:phosphoribosyltransferase [Candidatus Daviesbacteria bacterium]